MREITLSSLAATKMILHCYKYPHLPVNGVLLVDNNYDGEIFISDCIPLFHQGLTLKPMLQVALRQIDEFCAEHNLSIFGYYESPQVPRASAAPSPFAEKIGDRLRESIKEAVLFTNTWRCSADDGKFDIAPFVKEESGEKWKHAPNLLRFQSKTVFQTISTLYKKNFFMEIQDFDCYLDNFQNDWTNQKMNTLIDLVDSENE